MARSAQYRVTVNGFSVKTPTWDNALNIDGWGDEVYIATNVLLMDTLGNKIFEDQPVSSTIGDANGQPGRVSGGNATNHGGFRANDAFPSGPPGYRERLTRTTCPPCPFGRAHLRRASTFCC